MSHYKSISMQLALWSTSFECDDFLRIFDQASNLSRYTNITHLILPLKIYFCNIEPRLRASITDEVVKNRFTRQTCPLSEAFRMGSLQRFYTTMSL